MLGGRRIKRHRRRRIPPTQQQITARFKVPVSHLDFEVSRLDGTRHPWRIRVVIN